MDRNNQRESIEFERAVSIVMQYTTYGYNDEFWDSIWTILILSYVILLYLIVTFNFIGISGSPRKLSNVCNQGKELFVLLYRDCNFCIMTEWPCIEHICHITNHLDT